MKTETSKKFYQQKWFAILSLMFFAPVGIFLILKYGHFKKTTNIVLSVVFGIFFLLMAISEESNSELSTEETKSEAETVAEKEAKAKKKAEAEEKAILDFKGEIKLKAEEGKIHVNVSSNAPDGAIFEVVVMNGKLDVVSEFLAIKNGVIEHTFDVSNWEVGEVVGSAILNFHLEDHPQPDNIKAIYGQLGEKMTGSLVKETDKGGKIGSIDEVYISYPSESAVKEKKAEQFKVAINEIIEVGGGIIVDISPRYNDDNWELVNVVVSDTWYYSAEHEKERFAEQIGSLVQLAIKNAGLDDSAGVYLVDTFGKTVAKPKVLGGYEIE